MYVTYPSSDPGSRDTLQVETDDTLTEAEMVIDDIPVCLDAEQVGNLALQLSAWLVATRAR